MISDADISACGRYRYTLTRIWNDPRQQGFGPAAQTSMIGFAGLNPSVADAKRNDHTILKEIAFGKEWNYDGLFKINMYPWRETDPARLLEAWNRKDGPSIIGDTGFPSLVTEMKMMGIRVVICAWGTHSNRQFNLALQDRGRVFAEVAKADGLKLMCLGKNKDGSPKHTLYLPLKRPWEPWP